MNDRRLANERAITYDFGALTEALFTGHLVSYPLEYDGSLYTAIGRVEHGDSEDEVMIYPIAILLPTEEWDNNSEWVNTPPHKGEAWEPGNPKLN